MNLKGFTPIFIHLTEGKVHDSKIMDKIPIEANSYYLLVLEFDLNTDYFNYK